MKFKQIVTLFFCCILLLLAGCGQSAGPEENLPEPSFMEGEPHKSNKEVFRDWFKTMTSTAGPCTVSVRDIIYDEEQAVEWWYSIQSDLVMLRNVLDMEETSYTPFTIYIVDKTEHGPEAWHNDLYCTPDDILSGDYRESLIGAVLSIDEQWKQVGLASTIFSGEKVDGEQLATYLSDAKEVDLLCLAMPYFVDAFASEEELSMARTAAQLLCEHVLREHGVALLLEDPCLGCRQELLDELGVEYTYTDLYGDFDRNYTYSSSKDYPLIVTTERGDVFNIVPLPHDIETPADVRRLLYEAVEGPQMVLDAVKAEAPEYADIFTENYNKPFTCTLVPDRYGSTAWSRTRTIALGRSSSIIHEIMHLIVPSGRHITEQWKYEACAQYFSYKYYPRHQKTSDPFASIAKVYQRTGSGNLDPSGGNLLTYSQAATFADYLIQNYSLSTFLGYCLDPDTTFEEVYEIDFETAKAAWREDLRN